MLKVLFRTDSEYGITVQELKETLKDVADDANVFANYQSIIREILYDDEEKEVELR